MSDPRSPRHDLAYSGAVRARQRSRALVLALALGALALLTFGISIAKML